MEEFKDSFGGVDGEQQEIITNLPITGPVPTEVSRESRISDAPDSPIVDPNIGIITPDQTGSLINIEQALARQKGWQSFFIKSKALDYNTDNGKFFDRFNDVWGKPDIPFEDWPDNDKVDFGYYALAHETFNKDKWINFDDTIAKIIELKEDEGRDAFRNSLARLIGKTSHTDGYFFLNYNPYSIRTFYYGERLAFINALKRHYPRFKYYVEEIQENMIQVYWKERTALEDRQKLVTVAVIGTAILLGALTGGLSIAGVTFSWSAATIGGVSSGLAASAKQFLGVDISAKDIQSAIEGGIDIIADIGTPDFNWKISLDKLKLDPSALGERIRDLLKGINFADIDDKVRNFLSNIQAPSKEDITKAIEFALDTLKTVGDINIAPSAIVGAIDSTTSENVIAQPEPEPIKSSGINKNIVIGGVTAVLGVGLLLFFGGFE